MSGHFIATNYTVGFLIVEGCKIAYNYLHQRHMNFSGELSHCPYFYKGILLLAGLHTEQLMNNLMFFCM